MLIRCLTAVFLIVAALWVTVMAILPISFMHFLETQYQIKISGEKFFLWGQPAISIRNAAFVWQDKVELVQGDFKISLDPIAGFKRRAWSMRLNGDGARLRFLGDWLKKTGVEEVQTKRLRLALDFSAQGIQDIHTVELVAPDYQFQIQSRTEPIS